MTSRAWRMATYAAIAVWLVLIARLFVADLWDETNGMVGFSDPSQSLSSKVVFTLTHSLGLWRPVSILPAVVVLHFIPDYDVSWRVLRVVNTLLVLASLVLMLRAAKRAGEPDDPRLDFVVTLAFLFSGSAIISAAWYANLCDTWGLLFVMLGLWLLMSGHALSAGIVFGIGVFAKETVALGLPFLLILFAAGRLSFRQMLRAAIPTLLLTVVYFVIRSQIVPFGQPGDVHGFKPADFLPTLLNLIESFWRQTMKHRDFLGAVGVAIMLVALRRRPRVLAAVAIFFVAMAVVYWGMFIFYAEDQLVHYLIFVGRLYLIPVALMLFLLVLERKTLAIALLLVPIVAGAAVTYRDYLRVQRMYKRIYKTAAQAKQKPLRVHYPMKPLQDKVRGIEIGDIPDAPVVVDAKTARLLYR